MKFKHSIKYIFLIFIISGCKKFISIDPPNNQLVSASVFTSDATATAAISGLYSKMMDNNSNFANGGVGSVTHLAGLSADEFINYESTTDRLSFYINALKPTNSFILTNLWGQPYNYIYTTNSILEGLANSKGVSPSVNKQITGEAKFIRAFCYFYLVNLFGDIPLVTTTNYVTSATMSRTSKAQVYQQIVADLKDAQALLSDNYISGSERVRPNKSAAICMLARVYLYLGDYVNAEAQSTIVINNTLQYSLTSLNNVFLKNSREAIWQLKPVQPNVNTNEGNLFILTGIPSYVTLSNQLYNSFEGGDNRKVLWTHDTTIVSTLYHYPFKYKIKGTAPLSEYSMVLRLAEQYLIRAEARVQQNNILGSQSDLNVIRNRAGLLNTIASTQSTLFNAILHERQVELFTEWGHRWLDLKRTGTVDSTMSLATVQKGGTWSTNQKQYPIAQSEIDKNPQLTQNVGY